ncbi:MAG: N-acetylglucosaminyltransferase, partial [Clostridia bacterium]|nr:N-acetylglucosaminyltransferase [Clostridia bacterium]
SWKQRMRWAKGFLQVARKYNGKLLLGSFTKSFACYDMLVTVGLAYILSFIGVLGNLVFLIISLISRNPEYLMMALESMASAVIVPYFMLFIIGAITIITEWKKIICSTKGKIISAFTFPLFMMTYIPISIVALFKRVEWEPIQHNISKSIDEIEKI